MIVIGITGGVGCGKSMVMDDIHNRYDAAIYKADEIARQLQQPGQSCYKKIVEQFGSRVIEPATGQLDRQELRKLLFADSGKLKAMNQIVHPAVRTFIETAIQTEKEKGTELFLLEAALLIESGYEDICQEFWLVYASEEVRRQRLMESRGYTTEQINNMMRSQLDEKHFRKNCQRVIDNSDDFAKTKKQIDQNIRELRKEKTVC